MKKHIALIFGGRSSEHEVSLNSAKNIFKAIDKDLFDISLIGVSKEGTWYLFSENQLNATSAINDTEQSALPAVSLVSLHSRAYICNLNSSEKTPFDCAFPIIHGTHGEDGTLQGLFKILNVPFVGCGVLSSALCMDKEYMKIVMTSAGIANSKYITIHKHAPVTFSELKNQLGLPFFIKPANAGSSVGVHKIKSESDYNEKIKHSLQYDHKVIAEECINGREIECSVKGPSSAPEAAIPGELVVKHEFYSYEAKYLDENGAEIIIPAKLTSQEIEKIRSLAIKTYSALSCQGMARVDFFIKSNGDLIVNEVNTLPGFTKISMYPMMWKAAGLGYTELITDLIHQAFDTYRLNGEIKLTF